MRPEAGIGTIRARAFTIPTDRPEADGTLSWDSTTLIVTEVEAGREKGIGYTYTDASAVALINGKLAETLHGRDAMDIPAAFAALQGIVRNMGRSGLAQAAISALDAALWDVKAKLLELPLARLLGCARQTVPIYGSGGFTSYDDQTLAGQLGAWVARDGCRFVKMKVGSQPAWDPKRVARARAAIGAEAELFVDANGAYGTKQALALGAAFSEHGVTWFEEPVSSDDLAGLRLLRQHLPAGMAVAAGEYSFTLLDVRRMLEAGAVDVQQADATRCGGISGFLAADALCAAFQTDLSGHCAPSLHLHAACAASRLRHLEWFHDHVRIEQMLFDGAPRVEDGMIAPDWSRPGLGIALKEADAERFAAN